MAVNIRRAIPGFVLAGILAAASWANAAIIGNYGTSYSLADVISSGGIVVGDKTFANFGLANTTIGGAIAPTAASISITPVLGSGNIGLRFSGGWLTLQGQVIETTLSFSVTASGHSITSDILRMTGVSANDGGAVSIAESIFGSNPDTTDATPVAMGSVWYVGSSNNRLLDDMTFSNSTTIWVQKDIIVSGGSAIDGLGHLSIFYQTFPQAPEPCVIGVLCVGAAMLARRRSRSR